jgi:GNAT superfamily N-acetyltransferase
MTRARQFLEQVDESEFRKFDIDDRSFSLSYGGTSLLASHEGDKLYLKGLGTPKDKRNQGQATALLNYLCTLADHNGWTMRLLASPADDGMDASKLEDFYKRFSFEETGEFNCFDDRGICDDESGAPYMERIPK